MLRDSREQRFIGIRTFRRSRPYIGSCIYALRSNGASIYDLSSCVEGRATKSACSHKGDRHRLFTGTTYGINLQEAEDRRPDVNDDEGFASSLFEPAGLSG
jgi:hypothetical protein